MKIRTLDQCFELLAHGTKCIYFTTHIKITSHLWGGEHDLVTLRRAKVSFV